MRGTYSRGKIHEKGVRPSRLSGGYVFMDALVALFLVSSAFAGLAAFEALSLRAADVQRETLIGLTEERNELHAYHPVPTAVE